MTDGDYSEDIELGQGACILSAYYTVDTPIPWIHIMRVSVNNNSRMIQHPVEDGGVVFDDKVIQPRTITVSCYIKYYEYKKILGENQFENMLAEREYKFFGVRTKEKTYRNLSLTRSSHNEVPEKFETFVFELTFTQVMLDKYKQPQCADKDNTSTKK